MTLLRMLAFRPDSPVITPADPGSARKPASPASPASPARAAASQRAKPAAREAVPPAGRVGGDGAPAVPATPPEAAAAPASTGTPSFDPETWLERVRGMRLGGLTRELAMHVVPRPLGEDGILRLCLDPAHGDLLTEARKRQLVGAVRDAFGSELRVEIALDRGGGESAADTRERNRQERIREAERTLENDPGARKLADRFGASIVPGSVEPLD